MRSGFGKVAKIFFLLFLFCFPKKVLAISAVYDNPGQGIFQCHANNAVGKDYLKGGSVIVRWDKLQPIDNDHIDTSALNALVNAIKSGKKEYLHFQIYGSAGCTEGSPGCDNHPLPDWLNIYDNNSANDQIGIIDDYAGKTPQPWDSRYQQKLSRFLTLLNQALESKNVDPYIEYLEPAVGGHWGATDLWMNENELKKWAIAAGCAETDWSCLGRKYNEGVNKVVEIYATAFPDYALMIIGGGCRYSACSFNSLSIISRYGMRIMYKAASLGSMTDGTCGLRPYLADYCSYKPTMIKCGMEPYGGTGFGPGCAYDDVYKTSLRTERISYYCLYQDDIRLQSRQSTNQFVADHVGAQITLLSTSVDSPEKKVGDTLTITARWSNSGSASLAVPVKQVEKWPAGSYKLFLEFEKNGEIALYRELNITPPTQSWAPNGGEANTSHNFVIPNSLGGGNSTSRNTYKVFIGLTDPNGEKKRFALRNTTNNDLANRRYLLAESFTVIGSGSGPTETPTPGSCVCQGEADPHSNIKLKSQGNANCDNAVDIRDYDLWLSQFHSSLDPDKMKCADFSGDRKVDGIDFEYWRRNKT